ncbi:MULTISPECIES: DUF4879 domain-containing protein [unclassified Pseudoalteromonas]|uniref:DUF4879 domain-containing protein n=1 Tax=unclassified Pseudoalteromonas TaxID=194690 RepID=UPI0003FA9A60|nr:MULTISPECIES: DUF4879 domain-containing protein [unclassified Pseudoalteromonas]
MTLKTTLLSTILLSTSTFSGFASAADVEAGVVKRVVKIGNSSSLALNAPESNNIRKASSVARAAASGVTYFEIGIVYSTNYGQEIIQETQTSTGDHGGATLNVYLWQYGYGNPTNATMNGISKAAGYTQYRCGSDLHVCASGETITGWLYGYDFSGQESGQFNVGTNSTVSPFGYWSDSIYIN